MSHDTMIDALPSILYKAGGRQGINIFWLLLVDSTIHSPSEGSTELRRWTGPGLNYRRPKYDAMLTDHSSFHKWQMAPNVQNTCRILEMEVCWPVKRP